MPTPPADEGRSSDVRAWFTTTHWSVVLTARDEHSSQAAEALEKLCRHYWPPIYAFIRRRGHGPDDAQDLTQEFFARLLAKNYLQAADAAKGKFRTLLLTAVSRFLVSEWERTQTQKRGGGAIHLSLQAEQAEDGYHVEPADPATPESIYERRWAETVLATVLARLRQEFEDADQQERFEILKPWLTKKEHMHSSADVGAQLGLSEPGVYSAVQRLRQRYGQLLREEIAHTVASPDEIEEELRYLAKALS